MNDYEGLSPRRSKVERSLSRPVLPERIARLEELANNLWWSWHPQARDLFRALDYPLWRLSGHNPVKQLRKISPNRLQEAASDPDFLTLYESVMSTFDADMSAQGMWCDTNCPYLRQNPIAYFSMEFAIHNSLPIYAGGLGIMAGDTCKEASDLGMPLVGVGLMYPQGYFHQHISSDGWQEEVYRQLDFDEAPINPVPSHQGHQFLIQVQLDNRAVSIGVWQVKMGCDIIYLLDTNVEENAPQDRQLSARLYIADRELRIGQEIILGIGGVRVLRALDIKPAIWHANEGHTAFMMLERIREEVEKGASFAEAAQQVKATTVFTTHTPILAGQDSFPVQLVERYFNGYWDTLGIKREAFLKLGQLDSTSDQAFNMTAFALRMADQRNGVSQLHGAVARRMWNVLWPEAGEQEVPISSVTNGIHVPTWIAPELGYLYEKYLGQDWVKRHDEASLWERVLDIPEDELWTVHQLLKRKLLGVMLERAQKRWAEGEVTSQQVIAMGALLNPEVLTIGFVRRFTEYKRPTLIFHDIERLKRIVRDRWRPVQIIFAGKSHPADFPSKYLLHQVYALTLDREFGGRIAFVEDYDMHMAHYLVQGVDLWLNNPRRLQEACGTSGMKASLNGVLNLSILDGWWHEGYNGANGWAIGDSLVRASSEEEDEEDADALYRLLEEKIVPLYYERNRKGVPHSWILMVKEAIRSIVPVFCTRRMLKSYVKGAYQVATRRLGMTD
jgi:starch phosphorylase